MNWQCSEEELMLPTSKYRPATFFYESAYVTQLSIRLEKKWLGDRAALTGQLESLNEIVVRLQRRCEASETECRRLEVEAAGLKETNHLLNERIAVVMRRAASAADNSKALAARLMAAENERDALRSTIHSERQRALDLEHVALAARSQAALAYTRKRTSFSSPPSIIPSMDSGSKDEERKSTVPDLVVSRNVNASTPETGGGERRTLSPLQEALGGTFVSEEDSLERK